MQRRGSEAAPSQHESRPDQDIQATMVRMKTAATIRTAGQAEPSKRLAK
jgi:hypothetical protein